MVGHLLEYHPGLEKLGELAADGRAGRHPLHLRQPPEPGQAARRGERAVEPGRARRVGGAAAGRRGAVRVSAPWASPTCARASRTWCSASCASPPAWPPTCTCPGSTRTRSAASRSSGSKKMATFDDMELERKLTVYDKGFDEDFTSYGEYIARSGDIYSPRVPNDEPLRIECAHFVDRVRDGQAPRSDGASGLRVVRVLEAAAAARSTRAAVLRPSDRAPGLLLGEGVAAPARGPARRQRGDPRGHRARRTTCGSRTARSWASRWRSGPQSTAARRERRAAAEIGDGRHRLRRRGGGGRRARSAPARVVGDQAHVRERAVIGEGTVIGPRLGGGQRRDGRRRACGSRPAATSPPTR